MQLNAFTLSGLLLLCVCVSVCKEDEMADPAQTFGAWTGAESEKTDYI